MSFLRPKRRIYADAAAATPLGRHAKAELLRLLDVYGNSGGLHKEAQIAKDEIESAREAVAGAIGAHADEIIFTASGTEANNLAIAGILRTLLEKHTRVHAITSAIEHSSVLEPLRALEAEGLSLTILPVDSEGLVSPKEVADAITDLTAFVSIQMVNSEVGTIEPIHEIAKEIRKVKGSRAAALSPLQASVANAAAPSLPLYFHTDAAQAPLWLQLKVEKLGVDMLSLDAQKVMGPKGVGALFIKRGSDIEPQILGGGQEFGIRSGTPNTPLIGAFAVALADAQKNVEERTLKVAEVRDYCLKEMKKHLPDIVLNGPTTKNRIVNNLSVSVPGLEAQMAVIALDVEGVAASTRSACSVGDEEPSHVLQAIGIPPKLSGTAIRITLLPDATKADAALIASSLAKVAQLYGSAIANHKNVV